jgi:hypothetical protein
MAGPTAAVLVAHYPDDERLWLAGFLRTISSQVSGDDFWVLPQRILDRGVGKGRPFIWGHDETLQEPEDADQIGLEFGFQPKAAIWFAAMCNQPEDHQILGRLCEETARHLSGVIDFGGRLGGPLLSLPQVGKVAEINGRHVGTPDFLQKWLLAPRFRMFK